MGFDDTSSQVSGLDGGGSVFGPRGTRLWAALVRSGDDEARRVLAAEACRLADRLDRLDALLTGDIEVWTSLRLPRGDEDRPVVLVVDAAMAEARQATLALATVLAKLGAKSAAGEPAEGDPADDLARRREQRRREAGTAGS